jgi:hypothetical protein
MSGLLGSVLGGAGNAITGGLTTAAQQGEAAGIGAEANSNVNNTQGAFNSEQASNNQNTINSAQGETQAGNQSSAAAQAQQAASDQINQQLSASDLAAKESTAAHAEQEDAINSIASS